MDLNHFYFQHLISSMRAACASDAPMRTKLQNAADDLAAQIKRFQLAAGAGSAASWRLGAPA